MLPEVGYPPRPGRPPRPGARRGASETPAPTPGTLVYGSPCRACLGRGTLKSVDLGKQKALPTVGLPCEEKACGTKDRLPELGGVPSRHPAMELHHRLPWAPGPPQPPQLPEPIPHSKSLLLSAHVLHSTPLTQDKALRRRTAAFGPRSLASSMREGQTGTVTALQGCPLPGVIRTSAAFLSALRVSLRGLAWLGDRGTSTGRKETHDADADRKPRGTRREASARDFCDDTVPHDLGTVPSLRSPGWNKKRKQDLFKLRMQRGGGSSEH